uniref:Uncharacterized protein n=1 Tax=Arion vulgaris TaxID=1028688 RepID=A0A0B7BT50_9EUPU
MDANFPRANGRTKIVTYGARVHKQENEHEEMRGAFKAETWAHKVGNSEPCA